MRESAANRRIVCVGDFALGSRRAHAINVVKTAGGFARLGWEVLLLCREPDGEGIHRRGAEEGKGRDEAGEDWDARLLLAAYGEPWLRVEMLAEPGERSFPHGTDKRCLPMARWAVERGRAFGAQVMYARLADAAVLWAADGGVAIAETHAYVGDEKPGFLRLLAATRGERAVTVSTISWRLREHYVSRGAEAERVVVVPDGVDVEMFAKSTRSAGGEARLLVTEGASDPRVACGRHSPLPSPLPVAQSRDGARGPEGCGRHARNPLRNPGSPSLAVYAGHLYDYKGIPAVLEAAARLPGVRFELIGGLEEDIARVRAVAAARGLQNVDVVGWVEHAALPARLWRADVLLLPPGLGDPSKDWTSPVKLGEYLAAGAPIVASGIPALRDWVDETVVCWFEPDDAGSLAGAVERALSEGADAGERRRGLAMELARKWSYPERARRMLEAAGGKACGREKATGCLGAAGFCPAGSDRAGS